MCFCYNINIQRWRSLCVHSYVINSHFPILFRPPLRLSHVPPPLSYINYIDVLYILGLIAEHMYITIQHHVGVHNGSANGLSINVNTQC